MKRVIRFLMMTVVLAVLGLSVSGCIDEKDNPSGQTDEVGQWLSQIPGVSDVEIKLRHNYGAAPTTIYYFNFEQPADHGDLKKGTFKQRVALIYAGPEAYNIYDTQGYALKDNPDEQTVSSLREILGGANVILPEYRYYGTSQPEAFDNLNFTYLSSDQASADLHDLAATLQATGRFGGPWIATGVSKGGEAAALLAYYSSKRGYTDVDVYMPFCAPFCLSLSDPRPGKYVEERALSAVPGLDAKLKQFAKSIAAGTPLTEHMIAAFGDYEPDMLQDMKDDGMTADEMRQRIIAFWLVQNQRGLFGKLHGVEASTLAEYMPDPTGKTDLDYAEQFIKWDEVGMLKYIEERGEKARGRGGAMRTRSDLTEGEREALLKERGSDPSMAYSIQSCYESGGYRMTYDFLKGAKGVNMDYVDYYEKQNLLDSPTSDYRFYTAYYSSKMHEDFIDNYLPVAKEKLIFVYGGQDPWTGAAIPEPTNPNVKKFVVPGGMHNDAINVVGLCPLETYQAILDALYGFIDAKK